MKKILTALFFITLVLSSQNLFAVGFTGGTGTSGDPFQIANQSDLALISTLVNTGNGQTGVYFQQTANIALSGSWTPIGIDVVGSRFAGTYDGNGFTVTGLLITAAGDYEGLFGWVSGGTIKNLGVVGVSITTAGSRVGGLAAMVAYGSTVSNCYSTGTISSSGPTGLVGGLIGAYWDNNEISNCYSTATVSGMSSVGGLIGLLHTTSGSTAVTNCYSSGAVSPSSDLIGGFLGNNVGTNVFTSCYWDMTVSTMQVGGVGDATVGSDVAGVTGKTTAEMKTAATFSGWRTPWPWSIADGSYPTLNWSSTAQAIDVTINSDGPGTTLTISWTNGSGSQRAVFMKEAAGVITNPTDGTTYTANSDWSTKGTELGTSGYFCIYNGTGNTVSVTNTNPATVYVVQVFEYNGTTPAYFVTAGINNPNNATSMPVELTSFTSAVSKSGVTLKWSTATEVNNYGFNVERRTVNSAGSWVKIGFVAGHGTSNSTISYSYSDAGLASGRYAYRLKQIDNSGAFKYSQSIEVEAVSLTPAAIGLSQNFPNPFNPNTQITFSVASTEQAKLVVYNILGQPIVTLFEGIAIGQQTYKLSFDASSLSTGVYFYKLETPSRTDVRRMQLLK